MIAQRIDRRRPVRIAGDQHLHPVALGLRDNPLCLRYIDAGREPSLPGITIRAGWHLIGDGTGDGLGCADGADLRPVTASLGSEATARMILAALSSAASSLIVSIGSAPSVVANQSRDRYEAARQTDSRE